MSRTKYVSRSKLSLDNAQSVPYTQDNEYPLPGEGQEGEVLSVLLSRGNKKEITDMKQRFRVGGMSCAACSAHVEKSVSAVQQKDHWKHFKICLLPMRECVVMDRNPSLTPANWCPGISF